MPTCPKPFVGKKENESCGCWKIWPPMGSLQWLSLRCFVQTTIGEEFADPLFQRALLDVHMMVALNGAERTVAQW